MDEINFLHDLKVELEAYESDAPCFDKHLHEIISSVHNRLAELRRGVQAGPVTEPVIESDLPPVVHVSTANGTATYTDPKLVG